MTDVLDFERTLDDWFAGEDPGRAPDRLLASAMDQVGTTSQRHGIRSRGHTGTLRIGWRRGLVLAVIVLATVVAALLVAGALRRDPPLSLDRADLVVLREGRIVAIASDGTERELGLLTDDMLGSEVRLIINATVSPDGHLLVNRIKDDQTAGPIVFDLRNLAAPPAIPDVEGISYGFSPSSILGLVTSDGIAAYDPATGRSTTTVLRSEDGSQTFRPLTPDGTVKWAMDGGGILAETGRFTVDTEGTVTTATLGRLGLDGSFTAGDAPVFDEGLWARRVGPHGELLRCRRESDTACFFDGGQLWSVTGDSATPVWTNPDESTRIIDFSWAVDGGSWVLLETVSEGPREVSLVHVSPASEVRTVASFQADAADPDPNSYYPSAFFGAIAPDDSRLVVYLNRALDRRVPYLVQASGGQPTRIDREIIGWLPSGASGAPRPATSPIPTTDPAMQGLWTDGRITLRLGATRLGLDESDVLSIQMAGPDVVEIGGSTDDDACPPDESGLYRWSRDGDGLTLSAAAEPCASRAERLDGSYEASIPVEPYVRLEAGARLRSGIIGVPLSLTIPASGAASLERHVARELRFIGPVAGDPTSDMSGVVAVYVPTKAARDPCLPLPDDLVPLAPGIDGVIAYIDGLQAQGFSRSTLTETSFAGSPAVTFDLSFDEQSCLGSLFRTETDPASSSEPLGAHPRLTVIQHPDGPVVVIAVGTALGSGPGGLAWANELAASISLEPLE